VAGQLHIREAADEVPQRYGLIEQECVVGQEPSGHQGVEFGLAQRRSAECAEGFSLKTDAVP
jgi:hypothetical protein